jgi:hypothetical protein
MQNTICAYVNRPGLLVRLENDFDRPLEPQEPDAAAAEEEARRVCVLVAAPEQQVEKHKTFVVFVVSRRHEGRVYGPDAYGKLQSVLQQRSRWRPRSSRSS